MVLVTGGCRQQPETHSDSPHAVLVERATLSTTDVLLSTVQAISANARYVFLQLLSEQRVLVFAPDGQYVRTIGRFGAGPGEFDELVRMGVLGDTLWTLDWGLRRLSLFSESGELLATSPFGGAASSAESSTHFFLQPESLTPSGAVMGRGATSLRALAEGLVDRGPILYGARDGSLPDTLGWYSLRNSGLFLRGTGGPQPIPDFELVVYDGPGEKACLLRRNEQAKPAVVNATVTCLGLGADTLWHRTIAFDVEPVAPAVADSIRRWYRAVLSSYPESEVDAALHIPTHWPPVTEVFAGADGSLWLRGADRGDSVTYSIFDRHGADRMPVRMPKALRVRWASGDMVWAEQLDEDDVPTVSRFEIVPANGVRTSTTSAK